MAMMGRMSGCEYRVCLLVSSELCLMYGRRLAESSPLFVNMH